MIIYYLYKFFSFFTRVLILTLIINFIISIFTGIWILTGIFFISLIVSWLVTELLWNLVGQPPHDV